MNALSVTLIICMCILVPLVVVLFCIVRMFRNERKNSIRAGMARRASSIKRQQERLEKEKREQPYLIKIEQDKKEAQASAKLNDQESLVYAQKDSSPGIDKSIKSDQQLVKAPSIKNEPTREELKELMKGKTANERKKLLRDIEQARQASIHAQYQIEQEKLRNAERWV